MTATRTAARVNDIARARDGSVFTTPPDIEPSVISGLGASAVNDDGFTISCATNVVSTVVLEYGTASNFAGAASVAMVTSDGLAFTKVITGLDPDTLYYYRVRSTKTSNSVVSAWSSASTTTSVVTGGGAAWTDSGSLSGITATIGLAGATFESGDLELLLTEAGATVDAVDVQFRTADVGSGVGATRNGLPLWIVRPSGEQAAAYGSLLFLTPGTQYEAKIDIIDSGLHAYRVTAFTTRADNIGAAGDLVVTRYLDVVNGNDSNDGLTSGTAWKTFSKVSSAASNGAVIRVAPGWYVRPSSAITKSLTFVAQYPAVDDSRAVINAGNHTIIHQGALSGPTASSGYALRAIAPWEDMSVANGLSVGTLWRWTSGTNPTTSAIGHAQTSSIAQMGVATTLTGRPQRIGHWARAGDAANLAGWVTVVTLNQNQNHGFWTASNGDVYVILPAYAPSTNPNDLYVNLGSSNGLLVNGANFRVSGVEMRNMDGAVRADQLASNMIVDHCLSDGCRVGVRVVATGSAIGSGHVIQDNLFRDNHLWTAVSPTKDTQIVWTQMKGSVVQPLPSTTTYSTFRSGSASEGSGVGSTGGAQRMVVRRNTIQGTFNGVTANNNGFDRYASYANDIHDNLLEEMADDPFEPERSAISWRIWGNRTNNTLNFLSTAPLYYGPIYLVRNVGYRIGAHGLAAWPTGSSNVPSGGNAHKYSGACTPQPRVYYLHNTLWTDALSAMSLNPTMRGSSDSSQTNFLNLYMRNNLFIGSGRLQEWDTFLDRIDDDYNVFVTSSATRGLSYGAPEYVSLADVAAYRTAYATATGRTNANTNRISGADVAFSAGATVTALLTSPTTGDLTLKVGTNGLVGAGVLIPNVNDISGDRDLGYLERA